ncbi:hypothetical protein GCM10022221_50200 [Actinocorallia aurea]
MGRTSQAKVLVVDDEPGIREVLSEALRLNGFSVRTASSGNGALQEVEDHRPDLVVLDVMLPDVHGFEVARTLAGCLGAPCVLFLTAKDAVADRIAGLHCGGDDYVTKPFSLDEVILRIRAILRRARAADDLEADDGVLRYADLELDEEAYAVRRAGRAISLSPTEFALLRYLMINAERVVSKAQILDRVWDYEFDRDSRIVAGCARGRGCVAGGRWLCDVFAVGGGGGCAVGGPESACRLPRRSTGQVPSCSLLHWSLRWGAGLEPGQGFLVHTTTTSRCSSDASPMGDESSLLFSGPFALIASSRPEHRTRPTTTGRGLVQARKDVNAQAGVRQVGPGQVGPVVLHPGQGGDGRDEVEVAAAAYSGRA